MNNQGSHENCTEDVDEKLGTEKEKRKTEEEVAVGGEAEFKG